MGPAPPVALRFLQPDDEALYIDLFTDPDTMAWAGPALTVPAAAKSFRAALRRTAKPGDSLHFYAIVEAASGTAIGIGAQQPIDAGGDRAEVGMLLQRQVRGRGYATPALAALIDVSFRILPVAGLWVQYHPANIAAGRLCDRLGLRLDRDVSVSSEAERQVRSVQRVEWKRVRRLLR